MLKSEIRILGFDDGPYERTNSSTPVIGVIFRGGNFLDGILRTDVKIDGTDATEKIEKLLNSTRHKQQIRVIMFDGVTLGGFNVVDIKRIHEATGIPVLTINRKKPDLEKVEEALRNFDDFEMRWQMIKNAGAVKTTRTKKGKVYFQSVGVDEKTAAEMIDLSCTHSQIPEALRVAHLIATAIVKGESSGRA